MTFRPVFSISMSILVAACGAAPLDDSQDSDPAASEASLRIDDHRVDPDSFVVVPGHAPVLGQSITAWTKEWFRWHFAVPADKSPILNLSQDCGTGQHDRVFFVPSYDGSDVFARSCRIPARKPALVKLWAVINDYPCPDPTFQPAPGQSLEDFLREGAMSYDDGVQNLAVTVDGEAVNIADDRHTTGLFHFVGDPSLVGKVPDACLLGATRQPAVADGWWLMLLLAPGEHAVHVSGQSPEGTAFDAKYRLTVDR